MPVPRMRDGQFLSGTTILVDLIKNKFGFALPVIKRYISSAIGLAVGLGVLLMAFFIWHRMQKCSKTPGICLYIA